MATSMTVTMTVAMEKPWGQGENTYIDVCLCAGAILSLSAGVCVSVCASVWRDEWNTDVLWRRM